jgi:hypothetical protein
MQQSFDDPRARDQFLSMFRGGGAGSAGGFGGYGGGVGFTGGGYNPNIAVDRPAEISRGERERNRSVDGSLYGGGGDVQDILRQRRMELGDLPYNVSEYLGGGGGTPYVWGSGRSDFAQG